MVTIPGCDNAAGRFRLPVETFAILTLLFGRLAGKRNGLHRDDAVDLGIAGLVDHAHGSPAQFAEDFVSAETSAAATFHRYVLFKIWELQWLLVETCQLDAACALSDLEVTTMPITFSFSTSAILFACSPLIPFSNSKPT